jgi:hypothetical protein
MPSELRKRLWVEEMEIKSATVCCDDGEGKRGEVCWGGEVTRAAGIAELIYVSAQKRTLARTLSTFAYIRFANLRNDVRKQCFGKILRPTAGRAWREPRRIEDKSLLV